MNNKGTRRGNGEGSIYSTVEKHKRKTFLKEECAICKNCTNKCNRLAFEKCEKCENCKSECLKYCDRFYCYEKWHSQISINGKQTTVANKSKRKEANDKKMDVESDIKTQSYVKKNGITLLELIKKIDDEKYTAKEIITTTNNRNKNIYNNIQNYFTFSTMPLQKVTIQLINTELQNIAFYSQSQIDKMVIKIKRAITEAVENNYISFTQLPISKIKTPISEQEKKVAEAFDIEEEKTLIKYIYTHSLSSNIRNEYDDITVRNLIMVGLFSLARIGELGALDYTKHIDLNKGNIKIKTSLTEDENQRKVIGKNTKTGRKLIKNKGIDEKNIPFALFDKDIMDHIINQQIDYAKTIPGNTNKLLFITKTGKLINPKHISTIFKRICREANIKLELPKGCYIHMTRHTGITRLVEFGMDLFTITSFTGHTTISEIEKTYGHILSDFRNKKIEDPLFHYNKTDLITPDIKELILKS